MGLFDGVQRPAKTLDTAVKPRYDSKRGFMVKPRYDSKRGFMVKPRYDSNEEGFTVELWL